MNVLNEIEKYYDFETNKIEKNMDSTDGNVYHVFTKLISILRNYIQMKNIQNL